MLLKSTYLLLIPIITFAQPGIEWMRTYDNDRIEHFSDIYCVSDEGYIMCGYSCDSLNLGQTSRDTWVIRIDDAGDVIWSRNYPVMGVNDYLTSIIETDQGDFVAAGRSNHNINVLRLNPDGESIWRAEYVPGTCHAIIELKSGEFIGAGHSDNQGHLMCIDGDGETLWAETYDVQVELSVLYTLRETEGGVVAAGYTYIEGQFHHTWIMKADFEGNMLWTREYDIANGEQCRSMASSSDGGFLLAGYAVQGRNGSRDVLVVKVDDNGNLEWSELLDFGYQERVNCVVRLNNEGYALTGDGYTDHNSVVDPFIIRLSNAGQVRWSNFVHFEEEEGYASYGHGFYSTILDHDESILVAGDLAFLGEPTNHNGLLIKLEPDILGPAFIYSEPEESVFNVLVGDSVRFLVYAVDQQEDELFYRWVSNDDTLGSDSVQVVHFDELGEYQVQCQVTDGEFTAIATWHVTACEWYIQGFTPDSLDMTLRRSRSLDFSLDVRAVEGPEIQYFWDHIVRERRNEIGNSDAVRCQFDTPGENQVIGIAARGEESYRITWDIAVTSVVWSWWPPELHFRLPLNTTTCFEVFPFDPGSDSLSFEWRVNDEPTGNDALLEIAFTESGTQEVQALVQDGCEADTILWSVDAFDPEGVAGQVDPYFPTDLTLHPPSPNPFNSTAKVEYFLPTDTDVTISLFDLSGREVSTLAEGFIYRGWHSLTLGAEKPPAGIYFIRLHANGSALSQKVVLIK